MITLLTFIYVVVCVALIITVLLQSSKGEGLAGAFGGGGLTGAVFGGRGAANFLSRATTVLAIMFMVFAVVLSFLGPGAATPEGASAVQKASQEAQQSVPATEVPGAEPVDQGTNMPFDETAQPSVPSPADTSGGK